MRLYRASLRRSRARGASLVEYIVVVGGVALGAMLAFTAFGRDTQGLAASQSRCITAMSCSDGSFPASSVDTGSSSGDGAGAGGGEPPSAFDRALSGAWNGSKAVASTTWSFGKGVLVDGAWGMVKGIGELGWNLATHPIDTATGLAKGIGYAITNPGEVASNIGQEIKKAWDEDPARAIGRGVFELASVVVPVTKVGTAAKVADTATDAARVADAAADAARAADAASDAAKAADAAKVADGAGDAARAADAAEASSTGAAAAAATRRSEQIGEGATSRVYREGDNVRKVVKDEVAAEGGNVAKITAAERDFIAKNTVELSNEIHEAMPDVVPKMTSPRPGEIVQPAVDGKTITQLKGEAQRAARQNMKDAIKKAQDTTGLGDGGGVYPDNGFIAKIDTNSANFRFDSQGNITSWFDPVAVSPPASRGIPVP